MGMTILVTGANGFVGKNIVASLSNIADTKIVATDLQGMLQKTDETNTDAVTYLEGDHASKEFTASLQDGYRFDAIIHLAAVLSQAEDMQTYYSVMDSNIYTTFLLLETARQHNARILFPSTAMVYGDKKAPFSEDMRSDPEIFYALSKHLSEELIRFYGRKYDLGYVIFRIGILYGQWQSQGMFVPTIITKLLQGEEFKMTPGEQVRDFVHIDDFVEAVKKALAAKDVCGELNIGTGHAPSMKEMATTVERLTGVEGKVKIGAIPYRENELWEYRLDITHTQKVLGWQPGVSLEDGLRKTIDHYKSRMTL